MNDLKSKPLIIAKGIAFALIAATTTVLLFLETFSLRTAVLLGLLIWSACRCYYFLFYVLEHYVDPNFRYAGIIALLRAAVSRK